MSIIHNLISNTSVLPTTKLWYGIVVPKRIIDKGKTFTNVVYEYAIQNIHVIIYKLVRQ